MNTLTTPALTSLLRRLFADADAADGALRDEMSRRSPEERAAFMSTANTDYRGFYGRAAEMFLPVSRATGTLLYMLVRATKARAVVEYGTSFGLSTLHLAAGLKDNGGGRLIGSEFVGSKIERARANLMTAGLSELVELREGDALDTLSRDLPEAIDLVLLDGAKVLYPRILALLEPRLSRGAVVVADNADHSPEYLARVRDPSHGYASVPFADDVELSTWLGR
jgi:predicted O-methyltransferase YrrM